MKRDRIQIRCTAEDKKKIKSLAHKAEMTISEYMLARSLWPTEADIAELLGEGRDE